MACRALILFSILVLSLKSYGNACCAGGANQTNIITGDFYSQVTMVYQNSLESYVADEVGNIQEISPDERRIKEVLNFTGIFTLGEYWQISGTIPFITHTYVFNDIKESEQGLGDPSIQISYEILPELSYSLWKPRGFIFLKRSFANTTSIYDTKKPLGSDALGMGYNINTVGTAFYKRLGLWDLSYIVQAFKGESQQFYGVQNFRVRPGFGSIQDFQVGYQVPSESLRLALNLTDYFEGAKKIVGDGETNSVARSYLATGLFISYQPKNISYTLGYIDQGFLGRLKNINANRTLNLGLTYNLEL